MDEGFNDVGFDIADNGGQQHLHSSAETMPPLPLLPPAEETSASSATFPEEISASSATFPALPPPLPPVLQKTLSSKSTAEDAPVPQPQKEIKPASTGKKETKLEYEYAGVILPEDVDARRKLRNKLSAKVHRKRKQDALDNAKRDVEECDDTINDLKSQLTALAAGNPGLDLSEVFDELEKSSEDEEDELDDGDVSKPSEKMRPQSGSNPPVPAPEGMKSESGGKPELHVASILLDMKTSTAPGKKARKARAVAPVINGMDLPTAPDEESRKLRRLMRNRENARKSRERKKREMKKYTARRARKKAQISRLREVLNAAKSEERTCTL